MFTHNKRLQYTVRVSEPNPALANLLLEQFGGPQGELAAAMRYFTQALADDDPGRKDMLLDIATEELSHLEVIGSLVGMLNKGAKGRLAEGVEEEGELEHGAAQGPVGEEGGRQRPGPLHPQPGPGRRSDHLASASAASGSRRNSSEIRLKASGFWMLQTCPHRSMTRIRERVCFRARLRAAGRNMWSSSPMR